MVEISKANKKNWLKKDTLAKNDKKKQEYYKKVKHHSTQSKMNPDKNTIVD